MIYYNEHDLDAAAWLRALVSERVLPDGEIDERDIRDVFPADLAGFTQCHFFAGIGGWAYALKLAGWPDDRPVWTGSCPCQPFSAAGRGDGFADERHLWPAWFHLIEQCAPPVVFGEQVASKAALDWFDLVSADLAHSGYAVGAADLCAAGVGAPHIRQRLYWVADAGRIGNEPDRLQLAGAPGASSGEAWEQRLRPDAWNGGAACSVADASGQGLALVGQQPARQEREAAERGSEACGMADATSSGRREERTDGTGLSSGDNAQGQPAGSSTSGSDLRPSATDGFWRDADWLLCRDPGGPRWRPVEPGTFPLAHGVPARVGRLRGYGNAVVPQVAAEFVGAFMEAA